MKVLLLTNSLANGGLERQLSLLARSLPDDVERRVWSMDGGPHAGPVSEAGVGIDIALRRFRFDVTPAAGLWRLLRRWRPDVVHAWHWMPAAAAAPACALLGIPLIDGSIRMGSVPREQGRPRRGIMRLATVVVANSRAGLAAWRIDPPKGRVIYNAFDDERLRDHRAGRPAPGDGVAAPGGDRATRGDDGPVPGGDGLAPGDRPVSAGTEPAPFTVVMAARMDPPKDFATVVEAARLLAAADPGAWRFLLVGDGVDRPALLAQAAALVADGTIVFPEGGIEVVGHLLAAQIGVLMSDPAVLAEGCPNSIMEYMACGLPVVCADSGGSGEVAVDGETALVVAPRDAVALAAALATLRERPDLCARLGAAGRTRVEREFTTARFVQDYVDLYGELAARGRRVGRT